MIEGARAGSLFRRGRLSDLSGKEPVMTMWMGPGNRPRGCHRYRGPVMRNLRFMLLGGLTGLAVVAACMLAVVLYAQQNRVMVGSGVDGTVRFCVQGEGDPSTFYCSESPIEIRPGRAGQ